MENREPENEMDLQSSIIEQKILDLTEGEYTLGRLESLMTEDEFNNFIGSIKENIISDDQIKEIIQRTVER